MKAVSLATSLGLISTTKCQAGLFGNSFNIMQLVTCLSLWVCVCYSGDVADADPQWSGRSREPAGGCWAWKHSPGASASKIRDLWRIRQPSDEQLQTWEHVSALSSFFGFDIHKPMHHKQSLSFFFHTNPCMDSVINTVFIIFCLLTRFLLVHLCFYSFLISYLNSSELFCFIVCIRFA